jgi:hypothetical protein
MRFDQNHFEAADCGIKGGAQASGAAANDGQVKLFNTGKSRDQLRSVRLQRLHSILL